MAGAISERRSGSAGTVTKPVIDAGHGGKLGSFVPAGRSAGGPKNHPTLGGVLRLQATAGNRAVTQLLGVVHQAPLTESNPNGNPEEALPEQLVQLDMDGDEEVEAHTLLLDPDTGEILIQSDSQTLEAYLAKYKRKLRGANDQALLQQIEADALVVHLGRYGTKYQNSAGYLKTKAPTKMQRAEVTLRLARIAFNLQQLLKPKLRPPSHQHTLDTKTIGSDTFCAKVVMEPLSLLPRDDNIVGTPPEQETQLWRDLTNIAGYKRGHMLNMHLHGPGTNDNLVPISTAFNSRMREGIEKASKEKVNSENKVVRFEAEALDWGQYPGAFGFPNEKMLPNTFHFKLTKMNKTMPGTGRNGGDWVANGPVLYDEQVTHDIPDDVVQGVVAPTVLTFQPGLYFAPYGSIKSAPPNYHLKGSFGINNLGTLGVIAGLGVDHEVNLKIDRINATVLTEYKLPQGYGIKTLPPTEVEYIYFGHIAKFKTPDQAFVVYNRTDEAALIRIHQQKVADFKEELRLLAQRQLDLKQQQELAELMRRNQWKMQEEEKRKEQERQRVLASQNDEFRHSLLAQVRTEARKYVDEFGDPFRQKRESLLYTANAKWKFAGNSLIENDMEVLLAPIRVELENTAKLMREAQERIATLTQRFDQTVVNDYLPKLLHAESSRHFKDGAHQLFMT